MHDADVKLSVVIPTMNRPDTLRRTLKSFASGRRAPDQVVIVDQSQDEAMREGNRAALASCADRFETEYLYQEIPSLTRARNFGIGAAKYDTVIMSDDDVDLEPDTVANVAELMRRPELALIAGWNLNRGSVHYSSLLGKIFMTHSWRRREGGYVTASMLGRYPKLLDRELPTEWAMGYFFVIRRSLAAQWGVRWDEKLVKYAYAEDLDFSMGYCRHAAAEGLKCILTPRVAVYHLVSAEWRTPSYEATLFYIRNREYLRRKHRPGAASWFAVRWTNFGMLLMRLKNRQGATDFLRAWREAGRSKL